MDLRGMPVDKRLSLLRQMASAIVCQELHLPLAHEELDFGEKKLANNGKKHNGLLPMIITAIISPKGTHLGLPAEWHKGTPVSPAYTSMIAVK